MDLTDQTRKLDYFFNEFHKRDIIKTGHFRLTSGRHATKYVNKDILNARASFDPLFDDLCEQLAHFAYIENLLDVDVVTGAATGGIILSQLVAKHLAGKIAKPEIYGVYAEKKRDGKRTSFQMSGVGGEGIRDVYFRHTFSLRKEFERIIRFKKVFVVDDILTTGQSLKGVIDAVRLAGGIVEHAGVIWNRGDISAEDLCIKKIYSAISKKIEDWSSDECPMCKEGVPVIYIK